MNHVATGSEPAPAPALFRRRTVRTSSDGLVRAEPAGAATLPLMLHPSVPGVKLAGWLKQSAEYVERLLLQHGALLFRGFDMPDQPAFERLLESLGLDSMHYMEGATPRT